MNGLIEKLKLNGSENLANALNENDKYISFQIIKWVKNESGIDLYQAGPNGENLTNTELSRLRDIDLKFNIKFQPIINQNIIDQFGKLVGPLSGFTVVMFCIILDSYIIYVMLNSSTIIQGIGDLNPVITLFTGYYHAKAGEIISYWFGSSQPTQPS